MGLGDGVEETEIAAGEGEAAVSGLVKAAANPGSTLAFMAETGVEFVLDELQAEALVRNPTSTKTTRIKNIGRSLFNFFLKDSTCILYFRHPG